VRNPLEFRHASHQPDRGHHHRRAAEWVEDNVAWLFDFQLSAWTENEASWPENRDLKTFREWFRIDIHSVVVDVADDDIEGEEL
jgi:hypothetical protein